MANDNEIYSGAKKSGANQNSGQSVPKEFIEDDFQVPTQIIELASAGILYPSGQKTATIKYMTADAEDILYSAELIQSGKVLEIVLQEGVIDAGGLSVDDMLSGDRNQLLIELRKTGLGSEYYPGKMKCPSCKEEHEPMVNLDDIKVKKILEAPDNDGFFEVILPVTKKKLKFRFLNGQDEKYLSKASASNKNVPGAKNKVKYTKLVTERHIRQIMEIDGNRDKGYIKKFVGIMPLKDSAFLREYIKKMEPGVDTTVTIECDKCGHVYDSEISLNPIKLFYPNAETED